MYALPATKGPEPHSSAYRRPARSPAHTQVPLATAPSCPGFGCPTSRSDTPSTLHLPLQQAVPRAPNRQVQAVSRAHTASRSGKSASARPVEAGSRRSGPRPASGDRSPCWRSATWSVRQQPRRQTRTSITDGWASPVSCSTAPHCRGLGSPTSRSDTPPALHLPLQHAVPRAPNRQVQAVSRAHTASRGGKSGCARPVGAGSRQGSSVSTPDPVRRSPRFAMRWLRHSPRRWST
jgi:hypothetical protein